MKNVYIEWREFELLIKLVLGDLFNLLFTTRGGYLFIMCNYAI